MTVGISFTNGLEAVVITDARVSMGRRQSDAVDKMSTFSRKGFHGALFGTGDGNIIVGVYQIAEKTQAETVHEYVGNVQKAYLEKKDQFDERVLERIRKEIEKRSKVVPEGKERDEYLRRETESALKKYDDFRPMTSFMATTWDETEQRIKHYSFNDRHRGQVSSDHIEIGSGEDGANLYFTTRLQGIETKQLKLSDLAFFVTNAFSYSTQNHGVGGTPRVAVVTKKKVETLSAESTRLLVNISGAYLAEFTSDLTIDCARELFEEIIGGRSPSRKVATLLHTNRETLTTTTIPYSAWQERSNYLRFGK